MTPSPTWRRFESARDVARYAAETLRELAGAAARGGRRASVALSGGSTPRLLYELLAGEFRERVEWGAVEVFFGDERAVPPAHRDSNFRMARETFLDHVPVPADRVHPMPAGEEDLAAAARRYEEVLRARLPVGGDGFPVFDLVWLGVGEDGHTASLFPGTAALEERVAWVAAAEVPQLGTRRMTLTFPVLDAARRVQFLVTGAGKAAVVAAILGGAAAGGPGEAAARYPAARVRPASGVVEWLLDREAAAALA